MDQRGSVMTKPVESVFKGKPRGATSGNLQVCNLKSLMEKKVERLCGGSRLSWEGTGGGSAV